VADSTLIRFHLERKYGIDFDAALDAEQKAVAWAVERMCEEHLYFAMLEARWLDRANFENGLGRYMFDGVPMPVRPLAKAMLRRMNARRLSGQGIGRHSRDEIAALAARDVDALAVLLGDRPHLMRRCALRSRRDGLRLRHRHPHATARHATASGHDGAREPGRVP